MIRRDLKKATASPLFTITIAIIESKKMLTTTTIHK